MTFPPEPYARDPLSWTRVIFRHVPDFPGYGVDTDGSMWSCRKVGRLGGIAACWTRLVPNTSGFYATIGLRRDGKTFTRYVHHLVLETFVGPRPDGMECLHGRKGRTCNAVDNVRWGTSLENSADTIAHGTIARGERMPTHRLREADIPEVFRLRKLGLLHREIADHFGVCEGTITAVLNRKTWRHVAV